MSFYDGPAPSYDVNDTMDDMVRKIRKKNPHVFLCFFRSKNNNIAIYELFREKVDNYWLELEKSEKYLLGRRRKGIEHDRVEFNKFDKLVYGVKTGPAENVKGKKKIKLEFDLIPCPFDVIYTDKDAKLFLKLDDKTYFVRYMYIDAIENIGSIIKNFIKGIMDTKSMKRMIAKSMYKNVRKLIFHMIDIKTKKLETRVVISDGQFLVHQFKEYYNKL